jgi:radical SAM protein with 4Fe4S-binding SPASM domain
MNTLRELCLEVTAECYQNCLYCSSFDDLTRKNKSEHLPFSIIKKVIEQFKKLGGQVLQLSGGEPILHPDIFRIISFAHKNIEDIILYTSGVFPHTYDPSTLFPELKEIGLQKVVFNCQGTLNIHDKLTGTKGAFEKLQISIQEAKKAGFWIGVHYVPNKQNINCLADVVKLLVATEIDEIAFLRLVKQGRAVRNWNQLEMNEQEYLVFFQNLYELHKLYKETQTKFRLGCPFDFIKILYPDWPYMSVCHAGKSSLDIMADGTVLPCPAFKDIEDAYLGNIYSDSLENIWKNHGYLKKIRKLRPEDIEQCNQCEFMESCAGRCIAQRYLAYGNIYDGPDPLCKKLNLIKTRSTTHPAHNYVVKISMDIFEERTNKVFIVSNSV